MIDATVVANSDADEVEPGVLPLRMSASKNWRSDGYIQFPVSLSWPVSYSEFDGAPCDAASAAYGDGGAAGDSDGGCLDDGSRARGIVLTSRSSESGRVDFVRGVSFGWEELGMGG